MPSRRAILRRGLVGVGLGVGTAGCSALGGEDPPALTIRFLNYTDEHRLVVLHLFRDDRTAYQDAEAFYDTVDVPSMDDATDPVTYEDVVPSRRYVARAEIDHDPLAQEATTEYHYYPRQCDDGDVLTVVCRPYVEEHARSGLYFTFEQERC
ncbi:hypothetical protein BV210_06040 [Halorientalis sp. IM1011]|uniref:hypothetical protein n=1 Tax=Halorientalis sp. IM1011 TaxID=1932360 RepID=UPI00097CD16C|nr:hypothetical protein [Halorientalis sp. IM1011]AQL42300.1 hypothetical protein BV210_06040 [Halorientalis sp. IM1011]